MPTVGRTERFRLNLGSPTVDGTGECKIVPIPNAIRIAASAKVNIVHASGWDNGTIKIQKSLDQLQWGDLFTFTADSVAATTNVCAAFIRGAVTVGASSTSPNVDVAIHYQEEI